MNKEIKFSLYPVSGAARERGGYRARLIKERGGEAAFHVCEGKEGAVWA